MICTFNNKKENIFKFNTLAAAKRFSQSTIKASVIMLGDDELFWVVSLATMVRLMRGGYELAE